MRALGAVATVAVFFGTAALAPFSIANADTTSGPESEPAQTLVSSPAIGSVLEIGVPAAEIAEGAGTAGGGGGAASSGALYTLAQFMFSGVVNWGGYRFTYYSQQVLPGSGLAIPGRHVNDDGFVSDADGYIVLAGDAPKGTVYETPFGRPGKIYDRGTVGNHLDVYIR